MKFIIHKQLLQDVLARVQTITNRKTDLAITSTVLIKAEGNKITLMASDAENGMEGVYPATVEKEGIVAINSKKLYEISKEFPADHMVINEIQNRLIEIKNGKIEYRIVGLNPDDYPEMPYVGDIDMFEMDAADFAAMIEKTVFVGGSHDDSRPHANGCYFERSETDEGKILSMVSTDGNRLAKVTYVYPQNADFETAPGILIPKKGLHEISKSLDENGTIRIGFKENQIVVKKDNETIIYRLMEGEFPKYHAILEQRNEGHPIEVNKQDFLMTLKRMSILTTEDNKGVIFNFRNGKLVITTTHPELGESKEDMDIEFDGDPLELAFNPKYFIEALNMIDEDTVVLHVIQKNRPCFILGYNNKNSLNAIMPMII